MSKVATTIGLVLVLAVIGTGLAPQSAADLYQRALTMEKAEGNLEEAIALYQKVVDKGDDEALAAQAQLHIGFCYEKLGLGKAREAYQRVIDRFPRQVDVVKTARDKLAQLVAARADKRVGSGEINVRRVFDDYGPEWGNALSSDGRYLVYTDWTTGDMAVVDLITKERRRITNDGGLDKTEKACGETSAFSPDDKRVAYGWQGADKVSELRVIDFDGTDRRVLYRDENAIWIRPHAWSPDGRTILINLMRRDGGCEIALLSVADGKVRIVRKVGFKDPEMALSPDGTLIAYSTRSQAGSTKREIFIMKTDGTGHEALVSNPADDYLLGWSPDGRRVVFASDRTGSFGVWAIGVANGRADGAPQWIKSDLTPTPVRLTPNGTLHYMTYESMFEVYTAPIEPETGKSLGAPTAVKSQRTGVRSNPDWSPDGKRLVYKSFSGTETKYEADALISVYDLGSGEETQIEAGVASPLAVIEPRWRPDGRSVLLVGARSREENGIFQIDLPGGAAKLLVKVPAGQYIFQTAWSPDGKSIYYTQGNPVKVLRRDLTSGEDIELASMNGPIGLPRISLSPDGKWLAFTSLDKMLEPVKLMLVPADGGAAREIYRTEAGVMIQWISWTVDGRSIWVKTYRASSEPKGKHAIEFLGMTPDGQSIRKLEMSLLGAMDLRFHPDGRQVAFTAGQSKLELWALENFLRPLIKAK